MSHDAFAEKCCPVCGWHQLVYRFPSSTGVFFECVGCGVFLCDQTRPQAEQKKSSFWSDEARANSNALSLQEMRHYLDLLPKPTKGQKLLEIGCRDGSFLLEARSRGFEIAGFEGNATFAKAASDLLGPNIVSHAEDTEGFYAPQSFDVIVLFDLLGMFAAPLAMMQKIRSLLREDGFALFCIPITDSRPARILRQNWIEFNKRQSLLFNTNNIQNALFLKGFARTLVFRHSRFVSVDWLRLYLGQFKLPNLLQFATDMARFVPSPLRKISVQVEGGHAVVMTRAQDVSSKNILSIIIPVYNEEKTVGDLLESVLAKEIPGILKEIIVVESNSTDGSRDIVLRYKDTAGVKIIFQDKPEGKGKAVREGLRCATGDYILIQDADLEYDLNDYDALLQPLTSGRQAFVLGARHGQGTVWKMRQFNQQRGLSHFVNFGHYIFTGLINVLFSQKLYDPFTMFKVFRRDCLYGLELECNRFDFDFELLIKLILKGYRPIELPVNYRARSFIEGKKIRIFRDPLTWIKVLYRLRLTKIDMESFIKKKFQSYSS